MAEFLNYKVNLTLKDGTSSCGIITHVDSSQISLGNATHSTNPSIVTNVQINSSQIADLKVVQLPPDFSKSNKKNGHKKQESPAVLENAIIFAKPSTKGEDTPRSRAKARSKQHSQSPSSSVDWGQDKSKAKDFDFEANLAMFDKKSVFADFQKKDTVSPGDRLVGHNKIDKKEKYDNDEMVLDNKKVDNWDKIGGRNQSDDNLIKRKSIPSSTTPIFKDVNGSFATANIKLVHASNSTPIPLSSPVQLLEIERLSSQSFGVTTTIMTEVCATNLSHLITTKMLGSTSRLRKNNHNLPPLVLLLIGSSRCGSRAFATGRNLTNHGVRVLAFVINDEDDYQTDPDLIQQWKLFEKCGGKIVKSNFQELLSILNYQLDTPVELIVDALQGYDDHLEDIIYQEKHQETLHQLVSWCNESQQSNKILSLDIPSGIDGGSGTLSDQSLRMSCNWCVSMGLPITGLIHAYKNGYLEIGEVSHYLIDVGIPNKVYGSKGNLRKFEKFWYTSETAYKIDVVSE